MPDQSTLSFPVGGLNIKDDPLTLTDRQYRFSTNTIVDRAALSGRHGIREIGLVSETEGLVDDFQSLNLQGAVRYSPSQGQSAIQQADKGEFLFVAAGGRKFTIAIEGSNANTRGVLREVPSKDGIRQPSDLHQMWLRQCENYMVSCDDFGVTWFWDSVNDAEVSPGYNVVDRDLSRIPNRSRIPTYLDGRITVVFNDANMLIGDLIHADGQTSSQNILRFTEQTYWATGQLVTLPTNAGAITAGYGLPSLTSLNNQSGQIIEAENGVYFLRLDVPRSQWSDTQILFPVSHASGCVGQFAYETINDDAIRRTSEGIERVSFYRGQDEVTGRSLRISDPVDDYLDRDFEPATRFTSLSLHRKARRMFCTVRPFLSGSNWQSRGMLAFNTEKGIWESLWTFPSWCRDIKLTVPMFLAGEQRLMVLAGGGGKCIRLVEVDTLSREDVDCEGNVTQILKTVEPRSTFGDLRKKVAIERGELQFDRVEGEVCWEVRWKSSEFPGQWRTWASGTITNKSETGQVSERVVPIKLSQFPGADREGVRIYDAIQFDFQIRWTGKADLRFHEFEARESDGERDTRLDDGDLILDGDPRLFTDDEFEYTRI